MQLDFTITHSGEISSWFLQLGCTTFQDACRYVKQMPYKRNAKPDYFCVMQEKKGVCSTKHALLKQLCNEQQHQEIKLIVGIYEMNAYNTQGVGKVLNKYKLPYVVEAHTYLKYQHEILDFTKADNNLLFADSLIDEIEIQANQTGEYKINLHKKYMQERFFNSVNAAKYDLAQMWAIREECIAALFEEETT